MKNLILGTILAALSFTAGIAWEKYRGKPVPAEPPAKWLTVIYSNDEVKSRFFCTLGQPKIELTNTGSFAVTLPFHGGTMHFAGYSVSSWPEAGCKLD